MKNKFHLKDKVEFINDFSERVEGSIEGIFIYRVGDGDGIFYVIKSADFNRISVHEENLSKVGLKWRSKIIFKFLMMMLKLLRLTRRFKNLFRVLIKILL